MIDGNYYLYFSFFPVFLVLYVLQFFVLPLAMSQNFLATFFFNLLYALSISYYFHITFLGFNGMLYLDEYQILIIIFFLFFFLFCNLALPFLHNTVIFLYPIGLVILVYLISLMFNFNFCIFVMNLYFGN